MMRRLPTGCLPLFLFLLVAGCQGPTIDQSNAQQYVDQFISGRAQLPRDNVIALPTPWYTSRVYQMWWDHRWSDLAREVIENGYDMDLNWFYLGEAARGGSFHQASIIYYTRALADSFAQNRNRRCSNFVVDPNYRMCGAFVFPRDIQTRLRERQ